MDFIHCPSPNFDERECAVDILLLHYTGMPSGEEALARMCDAASKVAAHYCVEEDGRIFALVEEDKRAWHAGISCWKGEADVNARSVGIEIVNPGHEFGYRAFPHAQIEAVIALSRDILGRHNIPAAHVLGHSDVAPARKEDPGELFPWERLAGAGIGVWADEDRDSDAGLINEHSAAKDIRALQEALATFGYCIKGDGKFGATTKAVITAFQRHFMPDAIGTAREGRGSARALAMLKSLEG